MAKKSGTTTGTTINLRTFWNEFKKEYGSDLSKLNIRYIKNNYPKIWEDRLAEKKKDLARRKDNISKNSSVSSILSKISSSTLFISSDDVDIENFIRNINSIIHINDRINGINNAIIGKGWKRYDYMNGISHSTYNWSNPTFNITDSSKAFYSIVKFYQNQNRYVIAYPFWKYMMSRIFGVNGEDYKNNYQDICNFYTKLNSSYPTPLGEEPDLYMFTFMDCLGVLAAKICYDNPSNYHQEVKEYLTDSSRNTAGGASMFIDVFKYADDNFSSPTSSPTAGSDSSTTLKKYPLNLILYGPPGTGKTYHTVNKALEIIDDSYNPAKHNREENRKNFNDLVDAGQIEFITFHQAMSYEDFIEGIKPDTDEKATAKKGSSINYKKVPGIFKELANKAKDENDRNFVLIIDEINRGNIAEIFGELITLIEEDKRIGNAEEVYATLPYTHDKFGVPNNLYIIGTMNTADRSVESLDTALRRRFHFEEMMPNYDLLDVELSVFLGDTSLPNVTLGGMLEKINKRICALKDREHQIGHAYFMDYPMDTEERKEWLKNVFKNKVVPLLQEYFYGDFKQIAAVLGPSFVTPKNYTSSVFVNIDDFEFDEVTKYDVLPAKKWETLNICKALKEMALE